MTHLVELEEELKHHTELQESQKETTFEFDDLWIQSNFIRFMKETKSLSQEEEELIRTFDNHYIPGKYFASDVLHGWLVFLFDDVKETKSRSYPSAVASIKLYLDRVIRHHHVDKDVIPIARQIWVQIVCEPQCIIIVQSKFIEFMKVDVSLSQDEEDSIRAFDNHYIPMQYITDDILTRWFTFMSKDDTENNDLFWELVVVESFLNQIVKHHNIRDEWKQCGKSFPLATGTWDCVVELQEYNEKWQSKFVEFVEEKLSLQEEKHSIGIFYHNYIPMKYMRDDILSQFFEDQLQNDSRYAIDSHAYFDQLAKHHSFADEWIECGEHFPQSLRTWDEIVAKDKQHTFYNFQDNFIRFMWSKMSLSREESESIHAFDNHYIPMEYMHDTILSRWLSSMSDNGDLNRDGFYNLHYLQSYLDRIVQYHNIAEEWIKCGDSFYESMRIWHSIADHENKNIQSKFIQFMKQNMSLSQDEQNSIQTSDYCYIPMEYMRDDILAQWLLFEFNTSISDDISIQPYSVYLDRVVEHHNINNRWDDIRVYLLFPHAKATWNHIKQRSGDEAKQRQFIQFMKQTVSGSKKKENSNWEFDHNYIPMEYILDWSLDGFLVKFSDRLKTRLEGKQIDDACFIRRIRSMDLYLCHVVQHHNIDGEFPFNKISPRNMRRWHEFVASGLQLLKKMKKKTHIDARELYYILLNNRVSGPHTVDEITSLYIHKQINAGDTLFVSSADGSRRSNWVELQIPEAPGRASAEELLVKNYKLRSVYAELYAFVLKLALDEVIQIQPPKHLPEAVNEQRSQTMMLLRGVLGKLLFAIIAIMIVIHIGPLAIPFGIILIISNSANRVVHGILYIMIFIGFITTPIIVSYLMVTESNIYDKVQSWMIAYIAWGTASFMLLSVFVIAVNGLTNKKKQKQWMKLGSVIVFYIVGVDLGAMDLVQMIERFYIFSGDVTIYVLLMLPICAALLPAAIAGFIANFVLEEKFQLKCDDRIVDGDLCFNNSYGCCDVISSHNINNAFVFMGGLASNILACWAIIRICGYLLVHASSTFAVHANRKIRG